MAKIVTAKENKRWARKGWLLLVTTSVYLYLFVRVLWRVGDEGTLVYAAQLVSEGALPYRDFVEIMGPGTFYWLALFFKIFGAKWLVARGVLLLTGTITTILLYWMTRRLYRGSSDILPPFFYLMVSIPLWPATNHHWDSNLFALFSTGAFFLWQDTGRRWFLAAAGTIAGLTSCFMQQNVKNPTRYSVLLYVDGAEAGMKEALNDIKQKNVKYILWDTFVEGPRLKTWFPQYDHPPKECLYLEQYMESHYQVIGLANGFRILQRRDFSEAVN